MGTAVAELWGQLYHVGVKTSIETKYMERKYLDFYHEDFLYL